MKFTILGHASMLVEDGDDSILIDPWLIGSCYWRSWWNFPEIDHSVLATLKPKAIYITHLHWDHFHSPSLKLFSPQTRVFVPKVATRRMVRDLRASGLSNIVEMPHGKLFPVGDKLEIYSYQFGIGVDSALVVTNGVHTLFNVNDCKLFGLPLTQITNKFKKINFAFRSHSSAGPIPHCLDNYTQKDSLMRSPEDYAEEFSNFMISIGADYAVPFASNHCFLHKETLKFNETVSCPNVVKSKFDQICLKDKNIKTQLKIMPPGSVWDSQSGFSIREFNYFHKKEYINKLLIINQRKLSDYSSYEDLVAPDFQCFFKYFSRFFLSVPGFVLKKIGRKILFNVYSFTGSEHWLLDVENRRIEKREITDPCCTITVHANVINDCARKKMFSVWTASKRLKVRLRDDSSLRCLSSFFSVLDLYELGFFPLRRFFSARYISIYALRWREIFEGIKFIFVYKIICKKFSPAELHSASNSRRTKKALR